MQLHEARVVLTGASGGIGLAIADALCAAGAQVLAVARHQARLQPLLERYPQNLCWVAADLTFLSDRRKVLDAAEAIGGLNLLINAAGINHFAMLEQLDDSEINAMLAVLKQADSAMVVNVGSTYGSIGYPGYASYCATKFALRGFSEALRRELADTHVGVLYVAPRATRTSMNSPAAQALNDALNASVDDPQAVATAVVHAIAGDRRDLYLGWPERFFVRLNNLLPNLVDRGLRKQLPLIRRLSEKIDNETPKP
jgi:short-subunit dehydrogenase